MMQSSFTSIDEAYILPSQVLEKNIQQVNAPINNNSVRTKKKKIKNYSDSNQSSNNNNGLNNNQNENLLIHSNNNNNSSSPYENPTNNNNNNNNSSLHQQYQSISNDNDIVDNCSFYNTYSNEPLSNNQLPMNQYNSIMPMNDGQLQSNLMGSNGMDNYSTFSPSLSSSPSTPNFTLLNQKIDQILYRLNAIEHKIKNTDCSLYGVFIQNQPIIYFILFVIFIIILCDLFANYKIVSR